MLPVSTVPMIAAATVVPTGRISEFRPTTDAASRTGTESRMRVGMAAYPMPTPALATQEATSSCHGASMRRNAVRPPRQSTTTASRAVGQGGAGTGRDDR
ncbi:hypothetical protein GCM10027062_04950 [Nocardioides hungaricus]